MKIQFSISISRLFFRIKFHSNYGFLDLFFHPVNGYVKASAKRPFNPKKLPKKTNNPNLDKFTLSFFHTQFFSASTVSLMFDFTFYFCLFLLLSRFRCLHSCVISTIEFRLIHQFFYPAMRRDTKLCLLTHTHISQET